jgi:hypothetical protein
MHTVRVILTAYDLIQLTTYDSRRRRHNQSTDAGQCAAQCPAGLVHGGVVFVAGGRLQHSCPEVPHVVGQRTPLGLASYLRQAAH